MDLQEQLERSIGPAPGGGPDLETVLAGGRRAVRRRRVAVVGTALAAVLVVGGTATLATGGEPAADRPPVAVDTGGIGPQPTPREFQRASRLISWDGGRWSVDPEAAVLRQLDDPYLMRARGGASVALEVRWRGTTYWLMSYVNAAADDRWARSVTWPGLESGRFESWVVAQKATNPPRRWPVEITASPGPDA
jgi:hypothetical protein